MSPENKHSNQSFPFVQPEEVGMSSEVLAKIGPVMDSYISRKMVPNLVTFVARKGKAIHHEVRGYMDFESKKPAQLDTVFRLYSNTKPVTGTAVMICVEEGLLALDDPISRFLPTYKNQRVRIPYGQGPSMGIPTVPVSREMTVRDCLRNTTGLATSQHAPLSYLNECPELVEKSGILSGPGKPPSGTVRGRVEALGMLPLEAEPGTVFEYHVGFPVVGIVLEEVTGHSLGDFFTSRIFEPLKMNDTSIYLDEERLEKFPSLYSPVMEDGVWKLALNETPEQCPKYSGAKDQFDAGGSDGGILSTASDYARFSQMLLNGGELDGVRILSRKSVEIMTGNHTGNMDLHLNNPAFGWGMGVAVIREGFIPSYRNPGSYGWSGAAGTNMFIDPKEELVCVCFTQVMGPQVMGNNTYVEDLERLVYQAIL